MTTAAHPTNRQLRYLRSLASRTATTFVPPSTRHDASLEIERLLALSRSGPAPASEPERPEAFEDAYATAVRPEEVSGFGSAATWRSKPSGGRQGAGVGHRPARVQLLSYRVSAGERVLVGERRGERVRVTDLPADGEGQRYAVEELDDSEGLGPLRALFEEYKTRARELDEIPMAAGALVRPLKGVTQDA